MATKKKVKREFVDASTGETRKRTTAVVSAANKSSATTKRILSVILWIAALASEIGAILILNGTWYLPEDKNMYFLIGLVIADLILVVIGALLWKGANHLDPPSKKNKFTFYLWSQMGLIAAIICFLPLIILLLKNKDMDAKTKKIVSIVAAVALVIAALLSVDFSPTSSEDLAAAQELAMEVGDGTAYWTQFGKSYHLDPNCQTLLNSSTIYSGTVEEAFAANREDPCDFCALTEDAE
ncbi:MAG: hypothetical protein IKK59_08135 [Lachnospiraceae bacterium]|nr:hypothetical protein [Lachnospiraceae bacterium]